MGDPYCLSSAGAARSSRDGQDMSMLLGWNQEMLPEMGYTPATPRQQMTALLHPVIPIDPSLLDQSAGFDVLNIGSGLQDEPSDIRVQQGQSGITADRGPAIMLSPVRTMSLPLRPEAPPFRPQSPQMMQGNLYAGLDPSYASSVQHPGQVVMAMDPASDSPAAFSAYTYAMPPYFISPQQQGWQYIDSSQSSPFTLGSPLSDGHVPQLGPTPTMQRTPRQTYDWNSEIPPSHDIGNWNNASYQVGSNLIDPARLQAGVHTTVPRQRRRASPAATASVSSFNCEYCGRQHTCRSDLDHHARIHRERKHACSLCSKSFQFPKDRNRHMKTHNPAERHFFCTWPNCAYCTKGFQRKDHLTRHMTKHRMGLPPTPATTASISMSRSASQISRQ